MLISLSVYLGLLIIIVGLVSLVKPLRWARIPNRRRAAMVMLAGLLMVGLLLALPAPEHRVGRAVSRLDEFTPVWQFGERHTRHIAAPPAVVFEAIKRVRPDEIFLFRMLIWLRSGGQPPPPPIRDATRRYESLIDIATHSTFIYLADEPPREFVVGTLVGRPPSPRPKVTREMFLEPLPPGYALAAMNYIVTPDTSGGSVVSTETRVFANSLPARRRFAVYWRLIYPGSAMIRRMGLRAIERRATASLHL